MYVYIVQSYNHSELITSGIETSVISASSNFHRKRSPVLIRDNGIKYALFISVSLNWRENWTHRNFTDFFFFFFKSPDYINGATIRSRFAASPSSLGAFSRYYYTLRKKLFTERKTISRKKKQIYSSTTIKIYHRWRAIARGTVRKIFIPRIRANCLLSRASESRFLPLYW